MRSILNNKKGLSLMEILIGSLLFGLVVMTVFTVLAPMMRSARIANDFAEYNQILDSIGNRITSEMAQSEVTATVANSVTMTQNSETVVFTIDSGRLQRSLNGAEPAPVFPNDFYRGKTVSFTILDESPNFTVTVRVESVGGIFATAAVRERLYAVRPLLMTIPQPAPPSEPDPSPSP